MRKLLNKPWFVGALGASAVLFAVLRSGLMAGVGDAQPAASDTSAEHSISESVAEAQPQAIGAALHSPPAPRTISDPFALRPGKVVIHTATESVRLSAIWTEGGATLVLINDSILRAGQTIGSMTIDSATQDGVWMSHAGKRDFISLGETHSFSFPVPQTVSPLL